MQAPEQQLKRLDTAALSTDERKMLGWIRDASWEKQPEGREATFKAKVPEFFGGVRLFRIAAGGQAGALNPLENFIKKMAFQGCLSKQGLSPLVVQGAARFLVLTKAEMDNLGVGQDEDDE